MDYRTYRKRMRRLRLHGQGLRCIIVTTAFRLALQHLVDSRDDFGRALRWWYRERG